ncbi:zinc finger protein 883 isoform X2 [Oncorhynchus kisutch]|nr:zinc finger protein 883 isoform X2 [Oncorhynchus kisutch]XP_020360408.1 zinc finger protein 883 isoform X2 [Oncorhynchus kisutch]XP_031658710.1 zinc finger protein 883 isoform X2 [Oncorhynchus kisutch]
METVCGKGATLDGDMLMVIVKQEEEDNREQMSNGPLSSDTLIKQEQEEGLEQGTTAPGDQLPEETDTLEEAEEEKKRRKGKTEERFWSAVETEDVSGSDSSWCCRLCQRCFSSSWQLTGHCCTGIAGEDGVAHGHKVKLEFRCPVCGDRFLRPTAFIMHKRSHMGQSQYVCGVCGRTLKSLRKLSSHKRSHSRRRGTVAERQQCHDCSQSFCNLTALRSHRERQHGEERNWEDEEDSAVREEEEGSTAVISNDSTRVSAQPPQSPQCHQCFMTFQDAETEERHLRFKHPVEYERHLRGRTVFACCVCDRTFPSSRLLSAHQRTHSKWSLPPTGPEDSVQESTDGGEAEGVDNEKNRAGPTSCEHCHIIFNDPRTWERHMTAKHPPSLSTPTSPGNAYLTSRPARGQLRPYRCSSCGERFIQESTLTKHCTEAHAS